MTNPFTPDTWMEDTQEYRAIVALPVRLLAPPKALITAANTAQWRPAHVQEAIGALVLRKSPQVAVGRFNLPHFPLKLAFFTNDADMLRRILDFHRITRTHGWPVALLSALLHPKHVARDFAMSAFIPDIPYSAHEVLENHTRAIEAWRAAHTLPS